MRARALAFAVLLGALLAAPAGAQQLSQFNQRLTLAWARNDAGSIANFTAERGVSIDLGGKPLGPLASRQVSALLRKVFDDGGETVSVTLTNTRQLPGNPQRAYVELIWVRRPRGTTIPERVTVFVALVLQDSAWRITDIRLLP
jgi:hypothetical protein